MESTYLIYVEGGLHDITTSRSKALRMKSQFESEGWTVKIMEEKKTIVGSIQVEIY